MDASLYSPELKRQMVWLSGLLPYGQAEAVMARIGKRTISDSSLWRLVEQQGYRLTAEPAPSALEATPPADHDQLWNWGKMLSMDGGMVNIRQEGWKELKVGCLFDVELAPTLDTQTMDWEELAHARNFLAPRPHPPATIQPLCQTL